MVDTEGSTGGIINGSPDSFQIGADGESGGIVFNGKSGTVYGKVELQDDLTINEGETLTVGKDASLTVPEDVTLTNNGTINVESAASWKAQRRQWHAQNCPHYYHPTTRCGSKRK